MKVTRMESSYKIYVYYSFYLRIFLSLQIGVDSCLLLHLYGIVMLKKRRALRLVFLRSVYAERGLVAFATEWSR